jgi:hypothetical protein
MNPLEQVALGLQTLARAAWRLGDRALWVPFALMGAVRALAVGMV